MPRFDPIGVVEAAYRVDGTDEGWLGGVLEAARPGLDTGLGAVAWMLSFTGTFSASEPIGDGPDGWRNAFFAHSEALSLEQLERQYRAGCGTLRESMGGALDADAYVRTFLKPMGVADFVAVTGRDVAGHGVFVGAPNSRPVSLPPGRRATWDRVASHLTAGLRLRRTVGADVEAVLDGRKVVHAEGVGKSATARQRLLDAAATIDRARGGLRRSDPDAAVELWTGLVAGRWTLVDCVDTDARRLLIARRNSPSPRTSPSLTLRERQVIGYAMLGFSNKQTAYALGLTASGISMARRSALRKLGVVRLEDIRP